MRQMLTELETRRKINIETINELRTNLPNRESIQGGEQLYQNATLVPIGSDLFTEDEMTTEELARHLAQQAGVED